MDRQQLAAAYFELVGYDPFEDDPTIAEAEVAEVLRGYGAEMATDAASAEEFIRRCVRSIGLGFHPDTPFADYDPPFTDYDPPFTAADAAELDRRMDAAFDLLPDPYEVALDESRKSLSQP